MRRRTIEAAIELASSLKQQAEKLFGAYDALLPVLEAERRGIKAGDLAVVEAQARAKTELSETIAEAMQEMKVIGVELGESGSLKSMIEAISAFGSEQSFASSVLLHQLEGLRRLSRAFDERVAVVTPEIERNKILLETMLRSHQESYAFWQAVAEEASSAYDQRGVQKSTGRNAGFVARA